ncbi:MAG: xanthine dehydrogenase family protein molybdopterin-binding subunit [Burkholderiales bacterium]
MNGPKSKSRRKLLLAGAVLAGGGLIVGYNVLGRQDKLGSGSTLAVGKDEIALNGWVKIAADGSVTIEVPRSEMGQGVYTALPMLLAEELDADWSKVKVEQSPVAKMYSNAALFQNLLPFHPDDDGFVARSGRESIEKIGFALGLQVTGGSSSVRDAWLPMRTAGATARAMLVEAAAKKWNVPASACVTKNGEVLHPAGNRKAGYGELVKDAAGIAPPGTVKLKDPSTFTLIGKPIPRTDIADKVNGKAQFGIDTRLPGMLYAAVKQSPVFGGSLKSSLADLNKNINKNNELYIIPNGVAVVSNNWWRAKKNLDALQIEWNEGPNAGLDSAAIKKQLEADLQRSSASGFRKVGDADAILQAAAKKIEAIYEVPFLAHAAMEPINCTAQVKDGKCEVWASTQVPSIAKWKASSAAGVSGDNTTVHTTLLGGGFGRRLEIDMIEQAVHIARQLGGRPVQMIWTREEDMQHDMYRPAAMARFQGALNDKGQISAWANRVAAPSVGFDTTQRLIGSMAMDMPDKNQIEGAFDQPYEIPNIRIEQARSKTAVPVGSWRSVGHSYNAFFVESFMDEMAQAAGKDPYEFRKSLLQNHPRHRAVLELAAGKAGWGQPLAAGSARGIALHESFSAICAQVAEVSVDKYNAIKVKRVVCAIDCGSVVNPNIVEQQMESAIIFGLTAALYGEITIKNGRVEQTNFPSYDMLRMAQTPRIDTYIMPSTLPPGGVGEPGTPPIAPAVANALFALTGKRLRKLPLKIVA